MKKIAISFYLLLVRNFIVAKPIQLGCIYPAGAQQGKTIIAIISGEYLKKITNVDIYPNDGVEIEVLGTTINKLNFNGVENKILKDKLLLLWDEKKKTATKEMLKKIDAVEPAFLSKVKYKKKKSDHEFICPNCKDILCLGCSKEKNSSLASSNPIVWNIKDAGFLQLIHIKNYLFNYKAKLQRNRQLAQSAIIKIKVADTAKTGLREIRVNNRSGLTPPIYFMINSIPEVNEFEPNDNSKQLNKYSLISPAPLTIPVVMNGQIMPGDIDRFKFKLQKGETINIEIKARKLNPYLADSVPGWFQAVGVIYDDKDNELRYCDDYLFYPDPLFDFTAPYSGEFQFEIRDAIYRGREDFVYRVVLTKKDIITSVSPLTVSEQSKRITANGFGVTNEEININNKLNGLKPYKRININNYSAYNITNLPIVSEEEDNNVIKSAMAITLPVIINGKIERKKDCDTYRFKAKKGEDVVFDVSARSLGSPLDSFIRILNSKGKVIATNDDFIQKRKFLHESETGLITHHADSYLMQKMPYTGEYFIQILDTEQKGGNNYLYSLRVSKPIPHFETIITPSTINIRRNGMSPIKAFIIRKDGFKGAVQLSLKDNKDKISLINNTIPENSSSAQLVLKASKQEVKKPISISFNATSVDGKIVSNVLPADQLMQAFLYQHLVERITTRVNTFPYFAPRIEYTILDEKEFIINDLNNPKLNIKLEFKSKEVVKFLHIELYKAPNWLKLKQTRIGEKIIELQLVVDPESFDSKQSEFNVVLNFKKKLIHKKQPTKPVDIGVYIPLTLKVNLK
jgi:uncharacterized protein YdeI (BOF family)